MDSNSSKRTAVRISLSIVYFVITYIMYILSCLYLNSRKKCEYRIDILLFVTFLTMNTFGILLIFAHTYDLRNDRIYSMIIKRSILLVFMSLAANISNLVLYLKSYDCKLHKMNDEEYPNSGIFYFVASVIWIVILGFTAVFITIRTINKYALVEEQGMNGESVPSLSNYHSELVREALLHDSKGERSKAIEAFIVSLENNPKTSKSFNYVEIHFFLKYCSKKYVSKNLIQLVEDINRYRTQAQAQVQVADYDKYNTCVCCDEKF